MKLVESTQNALLKRWEKALVGIEDPFIKVSTAILLENQAKFVIHEKMKVDEDISAGTTTTGKLGTFQKFSMPLVRRVYPQLIANFIVGVQPMQGPTSQVFYVGHSRQYGSIEQNIYNKYHLTYNNKVASSIAPGANFDMDTQATSVELSSLFNATSGSASTTIGGFIAAWPISTTILGFNISAGERLTGTGIPEINLHIEQQPVVARTRKMRALWTIEAAQDLKAYHDLDLEAELTSLLDQELRLEIDRELIEDLRNIAYDPKSVFGGWNAKYLDMGNSNAFPSDGQGGSSDFAPNQFLYDYTATTTTSGTQQNVILIDLTATSLNFAPRHVGDVYANILAGVNFASQDIYKTTHRGPGTWILTSPLIGSLLESSAKLEGGLPEKYGPTNMTNNAILYKGKFAGKYDLFIDPLYPEDEMLMGYRGASPMDTGFVYCPYIPFQPTPVITDPESFQPRKGIMTRYGKVGIQPQNRYYRVIRIVGPVANFLFVPFGKVKDRTNS